MTPPSAMQRRLLAALALLLVPVGFAAHLTREGGRAIAASDAAAERGDRVAAIAEARRAASDDVPLVGHQDEGYDRLERLAQTAEAVGDEPLALSAWSAEHAAALSTSTLRHHRERLVTSSRGLAHLYKVRADANPGEGGRAALDEEKLATDLSRDETPVPRAALLALGGAAVLIAAAALGSRGRRAVAPVPAKPKAPPTDA